MNKDAQGRRKVERSESNWKCGLSPVDPTEFISQLAEFSALEQMLQMRRTLDAIHQVLLTTEESAEPAAG